jgi:hypothetical protein
VFQRTVQLVASAFDLATDDDSVARRLDDLLHSAQQQYPVRVRHALSVWRSAQTGWHFAEDDRPPTLADSIDAAIDLVDRRIHELALDALADHTKLHAGCAVWAGRRFLVVGRGGAGKTTLMTRLLGEEGCQVEGDELVLLHDGEAVAYPRRFGVRRLTLSLVPEVGALAPHLTDGPGALEPGGYHVLALDPARLNVPWRIGYGTVDVVFLLGERISGASRLSSCETAAALTRLMDQSAGPASGSGAWVRDLATLARNARLFELNVADLDSAVRLVRECVL